MNANSTKMLYGLYGSCISRNKACAYCYHHKCHLTVKMLKQHECLKKQCHALKKHEEHNYWKQRERKKELKNAHKYLYNNGGISI